MENIEYTIIQLCHVRCFLFVHYIMALGVYMFVEQFCWDFVVYIVGECNCKSVIYSVSCSCWRSYTTRLSVGGATVGTCVYRTVRHALRGVIVSSDINSNRKYFCCNISIRIAHKWHHSRIKLCIRKLSAHLGDSEATGCCRGSPRGKHTVDWCLFGDKILIVLVWQPKPLSFFIWEQIMKQSDKSIKRLSIPMYISPWIP